MDKVEVYAMDIATVLENSLGAILGNFTSERQAEILKYRFNADRNRTAYGELLVRKLLADRTGAAVKDIIFTRNKPGKPYWVKSDLHFNISHSGKWVVCSIGNMPSGVDVEIDQAVDMAIAKEYFLPSEYQYLLMLPIAKRNLALLKLWTIKESYLKYTGEGLSGDLESVDCLTLLQRQDFITARNFLLPDNAVIGVCASREVLPYVVTKVMLNDLSGLV